MSSSARSTAKLSRGKAAFTASWKVARRWPTSALGPTAEERLKPELLPQLGALVNCYFTGAGTISGTEQPLRARDDCVVIIVLNLFRHGISIHQTRFRR